MVVEMTVGLRAKAPVHSCTVRCRVWRIVAVLGSCEEADVGDPKIDIRLFSGLACWRAANSDSGAG